MLDQGELLVMLRRLRKQLDMPPKEDLSTLVTATPTPPHCNTHCEPQPHRTVTRIVNPNPNRIVMPTVNPNPNRRSKPPSRNSPPTSMILPLMILLFFAESSLG